MDLDRPVVHHAAFDLPFYALADELEEASVSAQPPTRDVEPGALLERSALEVHERAVDADLFVEAEERHWPMDWLET